MRLVALLKRGSCIHLTRVHLCVQRAHVALSCSNAHSSQIKEEALEICWTATLSSASSSQISTWRHFKLHRSRGRAKTWLCEKLQSLFTFFCVQPISWQKAKLDSTCKLHDQRCLMFEHSLSRSCWAVMFRPVEQVVRWAVWSCSVLGTQSCSSFKWNHGKQLLLWVCGTSQIKGCKKLCVCPLIWLSSRFE